MILSGFGEGTTRRNALPSRAIVQRYSAAASAASWAEYCGPLERRVVLVDDGGGDDGCDLTLPLEGVRELLLHDVPDHPLRLRAQDVERIGGHILVGQVL